MLFATSRYVQVVTIIGDCYEDYLDTQNYSLYVSDTTSGVMENLVGKYNSISDRFGKEIIVQKTATSVKL